MRHFLKDWMAMPHPPDNTDMTSADAGGKVVARPRREVTSRATGYAFEVQITHRIQRTRDRLQPSSRRILYVDANPCPVSPDSRRPPAWRRNRRASGRPRFSERHADQLHETTRYRFGQESRLRRAQ